MDGNSAKAGKGAPADGVDRLEVTGEDSHTRGAPVLLVRLRGVEHQGPCACAGGRGMGASALEQLHQAAEELPEGRSGEDPAVAAPRSDACR